MERSVLRSVALCVALWPLPSWAAVSRVFVSASGNDGHDCLQPATACRTINGGIAKVDAHGEVLVIASGSYAGAAISKSVTVTAAPGVLLFSSFPIEANPGAGGTVVLRGLIMKAVNVGTGTGITQYSGTLLVENTIVDGWETGLKTVGTSSSILIKGSIFRNNGATGVELGTSVVAVEGSYFERNGVAALVGGSGRISNSVFNGNTSFAVAKVGSGELGVTSTEFSNNGTALVTVEGGVLRIGHCTIASNGAGVNNLYTGTPSGTIYSYQNNVIIGNVTDVIGSLTPLPLR